MHAHMIEVRVAHGPLQRLAVEVDGAGARAEGAVAQINRVGPAVHGGAQGCLVSGGQKQFGKGGRHGGSLAFARNKKGRRRVKEAPVRRPLHHSLVKG